MITPMTGIVATLADDHSYHILHQHFGHTSWNALCHASTHLSGVPSFTLPADLAPCKGCQIGKMPDHAFPTFDKQASCPLLWCIQTSLVLCLQSFALILGIFLPSLMIILGMLFCPSCGPSWTVCLIFTIWSLGLRPLLVTLLPPCVTTQQITWMAQPSMLNAKLCVWKRSSRF